MPVSKAKVVLLIVVALLIGLVGGYFVTAVSVPTKTITYTTTVPGPTVTKTVTPTLIQPVEKLIEVEVGQKFTIILESNPTTGYQWQLAKPLDEDILSFIGSDYKTLAEEFPPPPGTGGIEIWMFEAVGHGTTEISMKYVRPWEKDVPPANEQAFAIVVK